MKAICNVFPKSHVVIVEPEATGHRIASYVRVLVKEMHNRNWKVSILTTRETVAHEAFRVLEKSISENIEVYYMKSVPRPKRNSLLHLILYQIRYYFSIQHATKIICKNDPPDLFYMVTLDYFEKAVSILGSPFRNFPFAGMVMSIKFHRHRMGTGDRSRNDTVYASLFRHLLRKPTLKVVPIIDETLYEYLQTSYAPEYGKLALVPDTGEVIGSGNHEDARSELGVPFDAFVILIYGSLRSRKGISALLKALRSPDMPDDVLVLLAGLPYPEVREELTGEWVDELRREGRLMEFFHFHDQDEEHRVFSCSNAVWLGYVGASYGSSGILYQAGSMGLPVIATGKGLIGWLTRRHNLGIIIDPLNVQNVVSAVKSLKEDVILRNTYGQAAASFAAGHTGMRHAAAICDSLEKTLENQTGSKTGKK